ncbi:MAG: hypothetical protein IPL53_14525 [Ignavibacteria bacterium]|nr:hypothetical protein [Ignavibacteria bacterium]
MKTFKIKSLLIAIPVCLLSLFCITDNCPADNADGITGRYINISFLENIADSIAGSIPFYCVEMNFDGSDSAEIFNGFEEYKLLYVKEGDDYILQNAAQGNDMPFMIANDSTIILIDTIWTGSPGMSVFQKVNSNVLINSNKKHVIDYFINGFMISGDYQLYNSDTAGGFVSFRNDGSVTGLENFTTYFICYSGDCVGETEPMSNTITFTRINRETVTYAFSINKDDGLIDMFNIAPPVKDIKGERAILDKAFSLKRK